MIKLRIIPILYSEGLGYNIALTIQPVLDRGSVIVFSIVLCLLNEEQSIRLNEESLVLLYNNICMLRNVFSVRSSLFTLILQHTAKVPICGFEEGLNWYV